jgi:uncharacterized membrane protein YccF (DUF307 family)
MRNIYISIAVMAAILFGGGLAVQHLGATAVRIVTVVGIAAGFTVLHVLDGRDRRRERAKQKTV